MLEGDCQLHHRAYYAVGVAVSEQYTTVQYSHGDAG